MEHMNGLLKIIYHVIDMNNFSSKLYWENRYKSKGNSGSGSYGILAAYKAKIINDFIIEKSVNSVVEFGCGDGNQLSMFQCNEYVGYDVSETIINLCNEKFKKEQNKKFFLYDDYKNETYDLSLSLDVIYHLIENDTFNDYMTKLFLSSKKYVIIYSSNGDILAQSSIHIYDRNFTNWIAENQKNFVLLEKIINPYKFDESVMDSKNTSISDFYIYKREF